jgi:twinkle protein
MGLTRRHEELLEARGLDLELLERNGVESCGKLGADTISIPYFDGDQIVNHKFRTISGTKKFCQDEGGKKIVYNRNCLVDDTLSGQPIIITEGEIDCWTAMQCGFDRVISVPDGAPAEELGKRATVKYTYLDDMPKAALDAKEIILAVDGDGPGTALLADLSVRLGRIRCKWVQYPPGCKDLNDVLQKDGQRGVVEVISRAQWMAVNGVYRLSQLPPLVMATPYDSGFPGLSGHYRLRPGDFCVITGTPSSGKTSFANDLACRMAAKHQWPVALAGFEQIPQLDHARMLRTWYSGAPVKDLQDDELRQANAWIDERFVFIVPGEDDSPTPDWLIDRCAAAAIRHGVKLIVIDPWNEIEHDRPGEMSLTEYVSQVLRRIKALARKYELHIIVVAHPAKMRREEGKIPIPNLYDISDSAAWANRADVGIIVHRKSQDETMIRVAKSRYHDQIGKPGDVAVRYIWQRATYDLFDAQTSLSYEDRR